MKYDIIIVLCPEKKDSYGKFPDFKDGMYLGGQVRIDAAITLYQENKDTEFILVGGFNEDDSQSEKYKDSQKTMDMKNYLENKGVEKEKLKEIPSLPCTRHNLIAVFRECGNSLKNKNIGLLTNFYHMPRTLLSWSELVNKNEFSEFKSIEPMKIIAEKIIGSKNSHGEHEYVSRIESELNGIMDIALDEYKDKCFRSNEFIENGKFEKFKRILKEKKDKLLTNEEMDRECPCGSKEKYKKCCGN